MAITSTTTHRSVPAGGVVRAHRVRPGAGRARMSSARRATSTRRPATTRRWRCSTTCGRPRPATRSSIASRSSSIRSLCLLALGRGTRGGERDRRGRHRRSRLPAERGRSVAARARRVLRRAQAAAARNIATAATREAKALVRSQGLRGGGAAVPSGDRAARRSATWADVSPTCARSSTGFLDLASRRPRRRPSRRSRAVAGAAGRPPPVPQPDPNRIYTMVDAEVTAPVVVRQDMPRCRRR